MIKKALITGITGQDGYYLTNFLLKKDYEVFGLNRNIDNPKTTAFKKKFKKVKLYECNIANYECINYLINSINPDEIYNLAAQPNSINSHKLQKETFNVNSGGVLNILETIKMSKKPIKFLQASSREVFGSGNVEYPQNEKTFYSPENPYAAAKAYSDYLVKIYRNQLNLFACSAILYNHESKMRGEGFVTKKISNSVANIKKGRIKKFYLGNFDAKRDWGHAKDYVECMWLILQKEIPEDYILATGKIHTVREFVELSFEEIGIKIRWEGTGLDEKGIDDKTGNVLVEVNPKYFRNEDTSKLYGDSTKAKKKLNWIPKIKFEDIVKEMVDVEFKK